MECRLYRFSKRNNSTKIVNVQPSTSFNISLKDITDLDYPSLTITNFDPLANYFYIGGTINRYYFITARENISANHWKIQGEVDYLASYKSNILATEAYILYDSHNNTEIVDNRIPIKTSANYYENVTNFPLTITASGHFCIVVTGIPDVGTPIAHTAFAVNYLELVSILARVGEYLKTFNNDNPKPVALTVETLLEWIGERVVNISDIFQSHAGILDNIKSCIWLPFDKPAGRDVDLYLGQYNISYEPDIGNTPMRLIDELHYDYLVYIDIPWRTNDWRRNSPFTEVWLSLPFVGRITLPTFNLIDINTLDITVSISELTGDISYEVRGGNNVIGTYGGNCAGSYPIGTSFYEVGKSLTSIITLPISLSKSLNEITSSLTATTIGGIGNATGAGLDTTIQCGVNYHDTIVNPHNISNTLGEPRNCVKRIGDLSGYVQTSQSSVEAPTTKNIIEKINSALDNGIYIE